MFKSALLITMAIIALTFSACSSSPKSAPAHNSDAVLWQQFQSEKAVDSLDKEK